jgi:hypothetical protein
MKDYYYYYFGNYAVYDWEITESAEGFTTAWELHIYETIRSCCDLETREDETLSTD